MIQSATCILTGVVHCAVFHTEAFFLCQSHNMPLLFQHQGESSLSFPRNCSLLPTLQWRHKTFSCVIVSQSPKYCSVLSPRQINHEKTASVCFLIASSCPHKHSQTFWTVSEKGQNLPSASNWNVPTEILLGYQLGCVCQVWHTDQMLHQREIQWFYPWEGEAARIFKCSNIAMCLTGLLHFPAQSMHIPFWSRKGMQQCVPIPGNIIILKLKYSVFRVWNKLHLRVCVWK